MLSIKNEKVHIIGPLNLGSVNDGANLGSGAEIFAGKTADVMNFRTLLAGSNVSIVQGPDEITISATDTGADNEGENVGTGAEVYKGMNGDNLQFRTLTAGSNVTVTENADEIEIAASGGTSYINHNADETESTTSGSWVQKLRMTFTATTGIRYKIEYYFELGCREDDDVDGRVQINDTTNICDAHFKNFHPDASDVLLWGEGSGGHYISNTLNGTINVDIDFQRGYGNEEVHIRKARLLVTTLS